MKDFNRETESIYRKSKILEPKNRAQCGFNSRFGTPEEKGDLEDRRKYPD